MTVSGYMGWTLGGDGGGGGGGDGCRGTERGQGVAPEFRKRVIAIKPRRELQLLVRGP